VSRMIALIGCGKTKLDRRAPARELYTGRLFRLSFEYAVEVLAADRIGILSAKHGLVSPSLELDPYDQELPRASEPLDVWGRRVGPQIAAAFGPFDGDTNLVLLAGEAYGICRRYIPGRRASCWLEPMRGMQIGERLSWLKRQLEGVRR
jgi:hypothetical protein